MPTLTHTLTDAQHAGLTHAATVRDFADANSYALRLVTDAAAQGMAELASITDAKLLEAVKKAAPEDTKAKIEAEASKPKVEPVIEVAEVK